MRRAMMPVLMRGLLALILGLALAGAGAAHRPVERPAQAAALAAFLQAGGTLADLCHEAGDTGHGGGHATMECPACQLQKSGCLVAVVTLPVALRFARSEALPFAEMRLAVPASRDERPPARGPPPFRLS